MIWAQADYFRVPLLDGEFGLGQIFETKATPDGSVFCGLSTRKTTDAGAVQPLVPVEIAAFVLVGSDHLDDGTWPLAGFDQIPQYQFFFDFKRQSELGFPDTPVHDPAVIEGFMNAFHGLYPWDAFGALFDQIKRPDIDRP